MKFNINKNQILPALQQIVGAIERRQTQAILSNVLIKSDGTVLNFTATDLEIELLAKVELGQAFDVNVTLPGRKLFDICKALPDDCDIEFVIEDGQVEIHARKSRFRLATLPAADFPLLDEIPTQQVFSLPQKAFKHLLDQTAFAMAQQDVRYYLNGILMEVHNDRIRLVATDGHRLALSEHENAIDIAATRQIIMPRKGVMELNRLLQNSDEPVDITLSPNHIRFACNEFQFTSKLIDGKFPDYNRVIPVDIDQEVTANRDLLKQSLTRISILSNEKYRGIRLTFDENKLSIQANNPDREEAEEEIDIGYAGTNLEIGFNVSYLLDVLSVIDSDEIMLRLKDGNSSCVVTAQPETGSKFVVMPMRL